MILFDLVQSVLNLQVPSPTGTAVDPSCFPGTCPASAFTAIGAAFATQGYWVQSDIIHMITFTSFQTFAIMCYMLAAFGGLCGMALGAPPKLYLWFFMGPAVFHWLLGTTQEVTGVRWEVAGNDQDQAEVWKLSEAGLNNTNIKYRIGAEFFSDHPPQCDGGDCTVPVATAFLWLDELSSSTVQWLVRWFGVYNLQGSGESNSNISKYENPEPGGDKWYLLSNLKWSMLDNITSAKLHSADLRDAFVTFLASECGDAFNQAVDIQKFIMASKARGEDVPDGVFVTAPTTTTPAPGTSSIASENYLEVQKLLNKETVPMPISLRDFLTSQSGKAGFAGAVVKFEDEYTPAIAKKDAIVCSEYLRVLIHAFRWESGHIFNQLMQTTPNGLKPDQAVYNLLYGWAIKDGSGENLNTVEARQQFLINLIFVHLVRNEFTIAPKPKSVQYSASQEILQNSEAYQKTVGAKSKYGEVYTWAMMIPYIQGVLFYILAMGYPFACMLIMVPGWHKVIFTWMSFWVWVKLWDVGFAVVMVLERSIWSILGNSSGAAALNTKIVEMQTWGEVHVGCINGFTIIWVPIGFGVVIPIPIPNIGNCSLGKIPDFVTVGVSASGGETHAMTLLNSLRLWDRAMAVGLNSDLDVMNSYYIYIMAALYFAVPAVTGQLVLGARAGAAGMVQNMIGGAAGEIGKAAGSGFTGDLAQRAQTNMGSIKQAAYAKEMRQGGFAGQMIDAQNQGLDYGHAQNLSGLEKEGLSNFGRATGIGRSVNESNARFGSAGTKLMVTPGGIKAMGIIGSAAQLSAVGSQAHDAWEKISDSTSGGAGTDGGAGTGGGATTGGGPMTGGGNPWAVLGSAGKLAASSPFKLLGSAGAIWQKATGPIGEAVGFTSEYGMNQMSRGLGEAEVGFTAQSADAGINQFAAGQYQSGMQLYGNRIQGYGQGKAEYASWKAARDFGNQAAGQLSAMGVLAGSMAPGPKPTDVNYLAGEGQANSYAGSGDGKSYSMTNDVGSAWRYAHPGGGFQTNVGNSVAQASALYGGGRVWGTYQGSLYGGGTPAGFMSQSFQGAKNIPGQMIQSIGSGSGDVFGGWKAAGAAGNSLQFTPNFSGGGGGGGGGGGATRPTSPTVGAPSGSPAGASRPVPAPMKPAMGSKANKL